MLEAIKLPEINTPIRFFVSKTDEVLTESALALVNDRDKQELTIYLDSTIPVFSIPYSKISNLNLVRNPEQGRTTALVVNSTFILIFKNDQSQ